MPGDDITSGAAEVQKTISDSAKRPRNRPRKRRGRSGRKPDTYAALDLGTNNCRLLIAKPVKTGFRVVDSYSKVVRLGAGLSTSGRLSEDSMSAAVEAIQHCSKKMGLKRVKRWRCVATQACRQASNCDEFVKRVKSETGIMLEVISPRVEARLSVMGCLNLIDTSKDVALVIDIGGGSTELSWVDVRRLRRSSKHDQGGAHQTEHSATIKDETQPISMQAPRVHRPPISAWASLPLGVVTLSEQVPETPDLEARYADMKAAVREAIIAAGCDKRFTKTFRQGRGHLIGTSGTITSLAAVHLKLPSYKRDKIDGLWISQKTVVKIARDMSRLTTDERAKEPSIGEDRAALLVAGCAIMDVVCEMWPCKKIRVADRGLREGILMGLMRQTQKIHIKPKALANTKVVPSRPPMRSQAVNDEYINTDDPTT